jgi:hypothetical protein
MLRTHIQLEADQMEWLQTKASAKGVSKSQLIRELIQFYRLHTEKFTENRKRKALDAVGRFSKNAPDVSACHDDYLAETYAKKES